jgi:hypothetical protein
MAFRRKFDSILVYKPDILIIPECEEPSKLRMLSSGLNPKNVIWVGSNPNKGFAIFSFGEYQVRLKKSFNPAFRFVIPLSVKSKKEQLELLAIWANNPNDREGAYIEQVWKAVNYYEKKIRASKMVIAGDFNSNSIWDKSSRIGNHSDLVSKLARRGIHSSYHLANSTVHGKEIHNTLYMYRHLNKGYHIDYCFMSADLNSRLEDVYVGEFENWKKLSDHVPLIVKVSDLNR